jgi:hypothetical protein
LVGQNVDAHFFLGALADEIKMPLSERAVALEHASLLEMHLKRVLPYIQQLRPFGSMVRRTALSRQVDPAVDLDCLLCTKVGAAQERFPKAAFEEAEDLMIEEIRDALELTGGLSNFAVQHQWINFDFDGIRFELSVGRSNGKGNAYIISIHHSEWGRAHPPLWARYGGNTIGGIGKDGRESEEVLVAAEPFAVDYDVLSEWERTLATGLVVILKYWNFLYRERIPSFVLERNVVEWLESAKPKGGPRSLFELSCTFLRNKTNYDTQLLQKLPSFQILRKAFRAAETRMACNREDDAVCFLNAVLPWPDRFHYFGPFLGEGLSQVHSRMTELGSGGR